MRSFSYRCLLPPPWDIVGEEQKVYDNVANRRYAPRGLLPRLHQNPDKATELYRSEPEAVQSSHPQ